MPVCPYVWPAQINNLIFTKFAPKTCFEYKETLQILKKVEIIGQNGVDLKNIS